MSIFDFDDVDQDVTNTTERRPASEHVGLLSMGKVVDGRVTVLPGWRIATGDKKLAENLGQLFSAPVEETDSTKEEFIDVLTDHEKLPVVIDGMSAVYTDWKLFVNQKLKHHCDHTVFISGEDRDGNPLKGKACGCPKSFAESKALADEDEGPSPCIEIKMRLADDPELGVFLWKTSSFNFAKEFYMIEHAIKSNPGELLFSLEMEHITWTVQKGKDKGQTRSFTKPALIYVKPMNEAVADEPGY